VTVRKTIRVRAGDGLRIPLPSDLAVDTTLEVITPETPIEVLWNRFTRRRLSCGDFVALEDPPEPEPEPGAPPEEEEE
jgi:hypothetical protein